MWNWEDLKTKFTGSSSVPYAPEVTVEGVRYAFDEPKRKYLHPPILIRNYGLQPYTGLETDRQFATHGWCSGFNTQALTQVYHAISLSVNHKVAQACFNYFLVIAGGRYRVRVTSMIQDPFAEYQGPRLAYMYLPGNELLDEKSFPTCPIFGGPTELGLETAREIGLALNLKIVAMEHDVKDGLLVVYRTMDPALQLNELREGWLK